MIVRCSKNILNVQTRRVVLKISTEVDVIEAAKSFEKEIGGRRSSVEDNHSFEKHAPLGEIAPRIRTLRLAIIRNEGASSAQERVMSGSLESWHWPFASQVACSNLTHLVEHIR
jgi:hypothetical protein